MAPDFDTTLVSQYIRSIFQDSKGNLWFGTIGEGVVRYDERTLTYFSYPDGFNNSTVYAINEDKNGNLWFGTASGAVLHEPARVPPQAVISSAPPLLSANTLQTVQFLAAYRQVLGIEFSTSLDSAPWSPWSAEDTWIGRDLGDGVHTLRVVARDRLHHVDPTPASCTFEIAATPPAPIITSPVFRQPVRDTLFVNGTAEALRFRWFRVDLRLAGAASWDPPEGTPLAQSTRPVAGGFLASLATRTFPDGDYELRLAVQDTLGLTGVARVTFVIDNVAPFAAQTTPALISALEGGDVFTTHREAHVYIPPRGLLRDATVTLEALEPSAVPVTLPDGAIRVAPGFAIGTAGVPLEKVAVLDFSVGMVAMAPGARFAVYTSVSDGVWRRVGGTLDAAGERITTSFSAAGSYALFGVPTGAPDLAVPLALSLTPRVFSSHGAFASTPIRISFALAREGSVRVTIHNRAGRLMRIVTPGLTLGPGTNVVSWDGKDEDRREVDSGMYFVTVEALGEKRTQALTVVR